MPTANQLLRTSSKRRRVANKVNPIFQGCPQKRGICLAVKIETPKKPNSAERKVAKVKLSTGKVITAYIPGEGHNLQQHGLVLVRGGKRADLPGISGIVIRGVLSIGKVEKRKTSRSKY